MVQQLGMEIAPRIGVDYNRAGWMTSLVDESGNTAEYEYDAVGRIIATRQTDGSGNIFESKTEYDAEGQVIASTDAKGRTTTYRYDKLGQLIETTFHDGTSIKTQYDAFGNEIAKTDQAGNTTYYEYDALDRLTAVVDAEEGRTEYQYDEAGNLVYQKDARGHITRFKFDGIGRPTGTIRDLGQESSTLYNEVGNVISTTDFNGETITYDYNEAGLLTLKTFEDGTTVEFGYNDAGQLATITDDRGVTSYSYNEQGNLLSHSQPDGRTITYSYNDAGKLKTIVTPTTTTTYTYDRFNFLDTVTANGQVTDYDYDVLGNLVRTTLPNGVVETRDYDNLNRLIELTNTNADGNIISSYDYTLDAVGNRTLVEELGGRTVAYEYDKLYRLLNEEITDSVNGNRSLTYTYDAVGNRLTLDDSIAGLTIYSYNNNDWLLSETNAGIVTNYSYDDNGNTISKISPDQQVIYDWNQENRLLGAEITNAAGTSNLEYQYDANGIRVASIVDGIETRYLVDTNQEYAQVLEEYQPDGTTNVSYVRGLNLISANHAGEDIYYINDGHSGVRFLTDESGAVTDSYNYDGYGNLLNSTGDTENNYLYRGEQFDPNLGMQYLRQRYYDTSVGRFASVDPFSGLVELPFSLHRYMYGNANPVSFIDPSGLISNLGEFNVSSALQAVLRKYLEFTAAQLFIGFSQSRDSNGQLLWDGALTGVNITALSGSLEAIGNNTGVELGPAIRGVLLEAETREAVSSLPGGLGSFDFFRGKWLILAAGFNFASFQNGGVLPGLYINQGVTIRSPKILGGNPGVLSGSAIFGSLSSGNLAVSNAFTVGFGIGLVNNVINNSGTNSVNASLSALAGISIPIQSSLEDPNPDSYPLL